MNEKDLVKQLEDKFDIDFPESKEDHNKELRALVLNTYKLGANAIVEILNEGFKKEKETSEEREKGKS